MFNLKKIKNKKYILPYLETHLVDHCNLKCNNCSHFSHLIDEEIYTDIHTYTNDLKELSKKIDFQVIYLLGGEPLLHPKINEFIIITRKLYPSSHISILTNGILLQSMKEDFWNTVRENRIKISISKYPIMKDKFSDILDLIDDKDVLLGDIRLSKKFYDKLNTEGNANKEKSYKNCNLRKGINLWKSRLYACQACYRYYYNKKNNTNLSLPEPIDFYSKTGKEIYEKLNKPMDACKYCNETYIKFPWKEYTEK